MGRTSEPVGTTLAYDMLLSPSGETLDHGNQRAAVGTEAIAHLGVVLRHRQR